MLKEIRESGDVNAYLQEKLDSKEKIMGFGHRVQETGLREIFFKRYGQKLTEGTDNKNSLTCLKKLKNS